MEKMYKAVRLVWALLLVFEAGMRVRKQMLEHAAEVAEETSGPADRIPDLASALNGLNAKLQEMGRRAAERAGQHNDGPGMD